MNFENLLSGVQTDTSWSRSLGLFSPELALCATIVALLLLFALGGSSDPEREGHPRIVVIPNREVASLPTLPLPRLTFVGEREIFKGQFLTTEPGPRLVELIDARLGAFATRYAATYPAAMKIVLTDRAGLTAYLRFPPEHHHRIRHSNFIERTFGETRRRTKVIGRFPGETSCVSIAWAVLDRASRGWRGLAMTPAGVRQLQDLRRSLLQPPPQLRAQHTPDSASSTTETISATA